jgi:hypothetical protein
VLCAGGYHLPGMLVIFPFGFPIMKSISWSHGVSIARFGVGRKKTLANYSLLRSKL